MDKVLDRPLASVLINVDLVSSVRSGVPSNSELVALNTAWSAKLRSDSSLSRSESSSGRNASSTLLSIAGNSETSNFNHIVSNNLVVNVCLVKALVDLLDGGLALEPIELRVHSVVDGSTRLGNSVPLRSSRAELVSQTVLNSVATDRSSSLVLRSVPVEVDSRASHISSDGDRTGKSSDSSAGFLRLSLRALTHSHNPEASSSGGAQLLSDLVFEASSALVERYSGESGVYSTSIKLGLQASSPFNSEVRDLADGVVNCPGDSVTSDALDERLANI